MKKPPTLDATTARTGNGAELPYDGKIFGQAIGVADGATFTLLRDNRSQVRIRLAEIDAPESGHPWVNESRVALHSLVHGKDVHVEVQNVDRSGSVTGRAFTAEADISAEMVWLGHAWVDRRRVRDRSFFALEEDARRYRRGLWSLGYNDGH